MTAAVVCPSCGSDDVEPEGEYATCCSCGEEFRPSVGFTESEKEAERAIRERLDRSAP